MGGPRSPTALRTRVLPVLLLLVAAAAAPFPPVPRVCSAQRGALAEIRREAEAASAAATPRLLRLLGSRSFREHLRACCSRSGVASWTASRLLEALRAHVYASELVHNFEGSGHTGVTLDIALHNATEYFPTSWELLRLGFLGDPNNSKYGHPATPADAAEEGVFRLPPFRGAHDLPATYEEASSRLQYVALNTLGVDAGNPLFGHVSAIFSGSYWQDAIAASPIDTGMYTFCCNKTYRRTPGSLKVPCKDLFRGLACSGKIAPGVFGAIDHAILNNHLFWGSWNRLGRWFERWLGDDPGNITVGESMSFLETNILGNILYEDRGIKMLVGAFSPMFGAPKGRQLREYASKHGIALAWSFGPGLVNTSDLRNRRALNFRPDVRLLDSTTVRGGLVNASAEGSALDALDDLWVQAEAARAGAAELVEARLAELWVAAKKALPLGLHLRTPAAWDCSDWHSCLGRSESGACVCYPGLAQGIVVV